MLHFYNKCSTCGNEDIILREDTERKMSKAGGVRALCYKCGRNTAPNNWNNCNEEEK